MEYDLGILGGGESGISAALLASKRGESVFLSEYKVLSDADRDALLAQEIAFEENGHTLEILASCQQVVKSPGIPQSAPIILKLRQLGIAIISEIEYAYKHVPADSTIIAITGSNGKTTTTNLIYHLLDTAGLRCAKGGNLGPSFSYLLCQDLVDFYVIEISSFQLEDIIDFKPDISVLLNISPDHLDRYDNDFQLYADTKLKICDNQKEGDLMLYNSRDAEISSRMDQVNPKIEQKGIHSDLPIVPFTNPYLVGEHNLMNTLFAVQVAERLKVSQEFIQSGLATFVNDQHRMQPVAQINGVSWINDSKATNVDAVRYALRSIEANIIWIVGGVDKGNNYDDLSELVYDRVKLIIALGLDHSKIQKAFGEQKTVITTESMEEAIKEALEASKPGDTVLLSPACASFDLFKNYKDRGNQFIDEVNRQVLKAKLRIE